MFDTDNREINPSARCDGSYKIELSPIPTIKLLSATFVCNFYVYHTLLYRRCNFCMQLHITCCFFPLKDMHICIKPLSTCCLLRRTKLSDPAKCVPLWYPSKDIFHRHSSCCHSSIIFAMSLDGKLLLAILYLA